MKRLPIILSTAALTISIATYLNTQNRYTRASPCENLVDRIRQLFGYEKSYSNERILPKYSVILELPVFDLPSNIRNDHDSVKALAIDRDFLSLTEDGEGNSRYTKCIDLRSKLGSDKIDGIGPVLVEGLDLALPNLVEAPARIDVENNIRTLLLTGGLLRNLSELSSTIECHNLKLKLIDLSDNHIRADTRTVYSGNFGSRDGNVIPLKDLLLHVHKNEGVLILIGNKIMDDMEVMASIAEIYPNEFLRLIWISEGELIERDRHSVLSYFFDGNQLMNTLLNSFPRFRPEYLRMIIASHHRFYDWVHSLEDIQREELNHLY